MAESESYRLKGSCLCGAVRFQASAAPTLFHYCSCESCRKATGSAHASNLFVPKESFQWTQGEALVQLYVDQEKNPGFSAAFCQRCGSFLPHLGRFKQDMVIPAGVLDNEPELKPIQLIYCSEMPEWYVPPSELPQHPELPPQ